jgi:hypothetical protein
MLFVMSWLLGAWMSRGVRPVTALLDRMQRLMSPRRIYTILGWVGQRLITAIYWLASVGEGDGWLGWALIVLALAGLYWKSR